MALSEDIDELKQDAFRLRAEAEGIACANPRVVSSTVSFPVCKALESTP